jgi:hypothetical protein
MSLLCGFLSRFILIRELVTQNDVPLSLFPMFCSSYKSALMLLATIFYSTCYSYLWEEWKEKHPESAADNSDKFLNLRFVSLEVCAQ